MNEKSKEQTFLEHLDELRVRLLKSVIAIIASSIIVYLCIDEILLIVIKPIGKLVFTSPPEAFMARVMLTILGGFLLASPVVFHQIWQFLSIGLTEKESKYIRIFAPFSCVCFLVGALFAYFVLIPIAIHFLLGFASETIRPMITVSRYISFVGTLMLACGAVFELPLIILFLTKIGIATPAFLKQKRRYAIIFILIASAILTPPDVITQLLMAVPLIVLYEVGILFSQMVSKD